MKKIEDANKSKLPPVKIDKSLKKYKDKILFKKLFKTRKSGASPKSLFIVHF